MKQAKLRVAVICAAIGIILLLFARPTLCSSYSCGVYSRDQRNNSLAHRHSNRARLFNDSRIPVKTTLSSARGSGRIQISGRDAQPARNHSLRQSQRERGRKILKFGQGSQE